MESSSDFRGCAFSLGLVATDQQLLCQHYVNTVTTHKISVVKRSIGSTTGFHSHAFNQEKALVEAFSVNVQPVVEPMDRFAALSGYHWMSR